MRNLIKVNKVIENWEPDGDSFDIVNRYDTVDAMWGMEHMVLSDEDIKALKDGKYLYHSDGEYTQIISYKEE